MLCTGDICILYFSPQAWKKKWFVLRRQTTSGSARLEYYRSEMTCLNGQCKRWIPLNDISSVSEGKTSRTHTNIFEIVVDKKKYVFSVDSLDERAEWISMIKDITLPKQRKNVPHNEYENGGLVFDC